MVGRYTCMLANPRTHIRSIMGNAIMLPLSTTRNVIAHGLETTMLVKEDSIRSKAMLTVDNNPLLELAKESYKKNHHILLAIQHMVTVLEVLLLMNGYNPHSVEIHWGFGSCIAKCVLQYQLDHNNLDNDEIAGRQTFLQLG